MESREQFQNIINLIRENFIYLIKRYFLFSILLLLIFSAFLTAIFVLFGSSISVGNLASFIIGGIVSAVCAYLCFPLAFKLVKKKEVSYLDNPSKLFNLYYGMGILISVFMTIVPLMGLVGVFVLYGSLATVYYLMGIAIVTFFMQIGGGLFAKGADISAALIAKEHADVNTNDIRNVSSMADKVGDFLNNGLAINFNLIEVFIGMFVAVILYVGTYYINDSIPIDEALVLVAYPFIIGIGSMIISFAISFVFWFLKRKNIVSVSLKPLHATYFSIVLIAIYVYLVSKGSVLPLINLSSFLGMPTALSPFICVVMGVVFALIIGIVTDIYTAESHQNVRDNAYFSQYSPVLSIFNGMSVGMKSVYLPIILSSIFLFIAFKISDFYGIILAGIGFASMLPIMVASSLSAPFFDTMNGIVRMNEKGDAYLSDIEKMNVVGNNLSAVSKHASSYAVLLMAFSFFFSFVHLSGINYHSIPLFHPVIMVALFLGGMFPYVFVSILLRALSYTVTDMYNESKVQLQEIPYLKEGKTTPDLRRFIRIHGVHIIKDLFIPTIVIFFLPFLIGRFLSVEVLAAFLIGCIMVSTFLSISYTNAGALLDNSKKFIEKGFLGGKGTQRYENAKEADLFGDCLKDVLGPAINAFLKAVILITIIFVPIII